MMPSSRSTQVAASSDDPSGDDPSGNDVAMDRLDAASWREGWLRARDQRSVVIVAVACLAVMAFFWWLRGGVDGSWRDIDGAPSQSATFHVDVNRADGPELSQLPGIGPTLAARWVADRETHGRYASHSDLQRISGIGPRTLERMLPYLGPIDESEGVDVKNRAVSVPRAEAATGGD